MRIELNFEKMYEENIAETDYITHENVKLRYETGEEKMIVPKKN